VTIEDAVRWVIETFEGRLYTNDPVDMGGATKFGITQPTLQYYRRRTSGNAALVVTKTDVEAIAIGVDVFAKAPRIAEILDWRVRLVVYDYGFHSGHGRAVMALQQSAGMPMSKIDGLIGPQTLAAVNQWGDHRGLALDVLTDREEFMQDIMTRRYSQRKYLLGWWKRTTKLQRLILSDQGAS